MKSTGIYSAFTFSLFLHVLIAAVTLIIARHSVLHKIPQTYVVTIVESSSYSNQQSPAINNLSESEIRAPDVKSKTSHDMDLPSKLKNTPQKDEISIKEQIDALQAKKRIEKIAALRKMVDIKSQESGVRSQESGAKTKGLTIGNRDHGGDYYSMVINKIKEHWIFPESVDKDLLTIVTIKILKDGNVIIDKIEKSSGNTLFDRSALKAISKASPLPPPPQEIEIGVRFRP